MIFKECYIKKFKKVQTLIKLDLKNVQIWKLSRRENLSTLITFKL
jgi:hypothetical protein